MQWFLVGVCGMALVHLSAPSLQHQAPHTQASDYITQKPRFYGVKSGQNVIIYCFCPLLEQVDWFWVPDSNPKAEQPVVARNNVVIEKKTKGLLLFRVTPKDSGIYYCQVNGTRGSGTGLQVIRPVDVPQMAFRSKVKDGLIFLQAVMLASCIAALLLRRYTLVIKEEAIYEDPQQDHIYEGLVVEACEGALYEDISTYAQNSGSASWEKP